MRMMLVWVVMGPALLLAVVLAAIFVAHVLVPLIVAGVGILVLAQLMVWLHQAIAGRLSRWR